MTYVAGVIDMPDLFDNAMAYLTLKTPSELSNTAKYGGVNAAEIQEYHLNAIYLSLLSVCLSIFLNFYSFSNDIDISHYSFVYIPDAGKLYINLV